MPSIKKQTTGNKGLTIEEVIKKSENFVSILNVPDNISGVLVQTTERPLNGDPNRTTVDYSSVEPKTVVKLTK
jgi:hypothetical protein